jgi:hypothetical protein
VGGKFQGQVVGISRSIGGGNYQGQVVGEIIKVKWWGYQGQLVGEIIKVKWWGYLGQVVGISRPSGGDIKVRGRGLEVKVKKKWWGVRALSNSLYLIHNKTFPKCKTTHDKGEFNTVKKRASRWILRILKKSTLDRKRTCHPSKQKIVFNSY